jgi:hypothetical protein
MLFWMAESRYVATIFIRKVTKTVKGRTYKPQRHRVVTNKIAKPLLRNDSHQENVEVGLARDQHREILVDRAMHGAAVVPVAGMPFSMRPKLACAVSRFSGESTMGVDSGNRLQSCQQAEHFAGGDRPRDDDQPVLAELLSDQVDETGLMRDRNTALLGEGSVDTLRFAA